MRVLVTGGAGYIGSHACQALAYQGHVPITVDNLSRGFEKAVHWGPFYHVDILETDKIFEILQKENIEAVLHFAALAYVGESVSDPVMYYKNNVQGSLSLLNAMKKANVKKIIFPALVRLMAFHTRCQLRKKVSKGRLIPMENPS